MTDKIADELRRAMKGVTPGPWYQTGSPWFSSGDGVLAGSPDGNIAFLIADCDNFASPRDEYDGPFPLGDQDADAAYIASCSPDRITALLDALDAKDKQIAELEAALEPFAIRAFQFDGHDGEYFCSPSVQVKHLRAASRLLNKEDRNG